MVDILQGQSREFSCKIALVITVNVSNPIIFYEMPSNDVRASCRILLLSLPSNILHTLAGLNWV